MAVERPNINYIDGEGIVIEVEDNPDLDAADVTISSTGGGHTIEDEGVPLPKRTNLDFAGEGVTASDDSPNDKTIVTVPRLEWEDTGGPVSTLVGGHVIKDEGLTLAQRTYLDFVGGAVTATDDAVNNKTIITIPSILDDLGMGWTGGAPTLGTARPTLTVPLFNGAAATFNLTYVYIRLETPGLSGTTVRLEKSTVAGVFTPLTVTTLAIGTALYEASATGSFGSVASGDKLRIVWTGVGANASDYLVHIGGIKA